MNLIVHEGLDFTGFQEGDSILLTVDGMHKMFYYGGGNWRWFHNKLKDVGAILKLSPLVEGVYDDRLGDCYRIAFVSDAPKADPRPDKATYLARKKINRMVWVNGKWEQDNG